MKFHVFVHFFNNVFGSTGKKVWRKKKLHFWIISDQEFLCKGMEQKQVCNHVAKVF